MRLFWDWPDAKVVHRAHDLASLQVAGLPRVEVLLSHAGASGAMVRSLMQAADGDAPLRGLVVAGTGNATLHKDLEHALLAAQGAGIRVVRVSRCAYGQVVGAATAMEPDGLEAYALSAVKARIALMLDIAATQS